MLSYMDTLREQSASAKVDLQRKSELMQTIAMQLQRCHGARSLDIDCYSSRALDLLNSTRSLINFVSSIFPVISSSIPVSNSVTGDPFLSSIA